MTDEEESSERLRDPVHVTLITCCVIKMLKGLKESSISGLYASTAYYGLTILYTRFITANIFLSFQSTIESSLSPQAKVGDLSSGPRLVLLQNRAQGDLW